MLSSGWDCRRTRPGLNSVGVIPCCGGGICLHHGPGGKPPGMPTKRFGEGCSLQITEFCYSQESSSSTRVEHPCYPKDYNETISLSSFHTSPCTNASDPRLSPSDRNVTLEGRGNASRCLVAIRKLFNFSACGQSQDCTFDGVYQPPFSGQFFVRQTLSPHLPSCTCPLGTTVSRCAPCHCHLPTAEQGQEAATLLVPQGTSGLADGGFSSQSSIWDHFNKTGA